MRTSRYDTFQKFPYGNSHFRMRESLREAILDFLSDGLERTVEEVRSGVGASPSSRIHHVLAEMRIDLRLRREVYRLTSRRVSGRLYYRYGKFSSSEMGKTRES